MLRGKGRGGRRRMLIFNFAVLLVVLCHCVADESESKVLELTEKNYDEVINNTPLILVEFYAPWCEYCQILEPKYESAAKELSLLDPPIPLAKVNGDKEKNLYNRMGLNGYPAIYVFHHGRPFEYEGLRRTDAIVQFMKEEARLDWKPPEDHVIVLTSDNFTEFVSSLELMLVEFYAPWCGHCKRLAPDYALAAKELDLKHNLPLAKIDATEESSLASLFGVDGYPTLLIFRYGKDYSYDGPRDRKGIVEFMVNQSIPATKGFSTMKELDLFVTGALAPVVVAVFPDGEQGEFWNAFLELANLGRSTPLYFWHSSNLLLTASLGLSPEDGGVTAVRPSRFRSEFEPALTVFERSFVVGNLSGALQMLMDIGHPLVGLRSKSTEYWWSYPLVVMYLAIDTSLEGRKDFIYWRKRLLPVAHAFEGRLQVVMSDEIEYNEELRELGYGDHGDDLVIGLWANKKEKYVMKEDFDADSLKYFAEYYFEGRLRPVLRSQRKPKKKSLVKVVVGSSFHEVVFDHTKDVLIEFYAPWCGHCKNLEPKYKELAKKFQKYQNIVIAKFDATANDAPPEFEYKGFPTIFFVPAGELNSIVKYEGGREIEDFSSFLKENAFHSIGDRNVQRNTDEL